MKLWYASLWCLLLGMGALAAGYIIRLMRERRDPWKHTTGKVAELSLRPGEDPRGQFRDRYYPVIEFYADGRLYRVESSEGSWPSAYRINQAVSIDYDPADPNIFQIASDTARDNLPLYLYIAGSILLFISVMVFLRYALR